jgi:RNA polymerase sigma-70 factor (ECF subfamily)
MLILINHYHSSRNRRGAYFFTNLPFLMLKEINISLLREGDKEAFEQLYRDYHKRVYAFMWRYTRDVPCTEELVQDTFVKVWTSRGSLNPEVPGEAQLFRIARSVYIDHYRRAGSRVTLVDLQQSPAMDAAVAPGTRDTALMAHISSAIENLPPVRREVFRLAKLQGMSYPEIAHQLSISPKTVEAHMSKALKYLRSRLGAVLPSFLLGGFL